MTPDETRPTALSKMVSLISFLVETSREGHVLHLSESDMNYLIRGRVGVFGCQFQSIILLFLVFNFQIYKM